MTRHQIDKSALQEMIGHRNPRRMFAATEGQGPSADDSGARHVSCLASKSRHFPIIRPRTNPMNVICLSRSETLNASADPLSHSTGPIYNHRYQTVEKPLSHDVLPSSSLCLTGTLLFLPDKVDLGLGLPELPRRNSALEELVKFGVGSPCRSVSPAIHLRRGPSMTYPSFRGW